jgi:hypothetical protein
MMLFIFLAVCFGCGWCFEHDRPELAILIGVLFGAFYLLSQWMDTREQEDDQEDGV